MNKTELSEALAKKIKITKKQAAEALDAVIDEITRCLKNGDKLVIPGFGTWSAKERAARSGRNPQTGAVIAIAAARVAHFKAGSLLKATVNKGKGKK